MALFGTGERVFVDDETGKIAYYPAVFTAAQSKRLFEHFARGLEWAQESMCGASFQYYRDSNDSVAWHSDHTEDLIENAIVAVVSLGAVREMRVRSKKRPRRTLSCALEPGSIFYMGGRAQDFWEHNIPKLRQPVEPRISIAFRQKR